MSCKTQMLIEHGLIPGHTLCPDEPGMENSSTIIPDTQKMNPNCDCPARTCPLHGFCAYCVQHHKELNRALYAMGLEEHSHYHHCKQDLRVEQIGHDNVRDECLLVAKALVESCELARKEGE